MDIYRDFFNREGLLRVLEQAPYTPGMLGELGIFETIPLGTTILDIEVQVKDSGRVLTAISRGAPRQQEGLDKRSVVSFSTQTFGDQGAVMADEVLGGRAHGVSGAKELIENRRARLVAKLRRVMDYTHEKLRMNVLTSPGSTEFGSAATSIAIAVQTSTTKLRQEIFNKLITPIEAALDGLTYGGITVLCSDGYWSDLIEAQSIKETYLNAAQAIELRGDVPMKFSFGGVTWARYRGTSACKVPDNQAIAVPTGVPETFFQGFAPNDTIESVGSGGMGQPYFLGSKPLVDSQGTKGWEVSIQSHPKMICGRPACIIPITKT